MKSGFKKIAIEFVIHLCAWVVLAIMFTIGNYRSNFSFWTAFVDFVGRFFPPLLVFMLVVYGHYYLIFSKFISNKRYVSYFFGLICLIAFALLMDNIHSILFFKSFDFSPESALRVFLIYLPYAVLYAFIKGYIKSQKEKKDLIIDKLIHDREQAELQKHTAELEMQVLRSQMNPHFIFNSLNSINRFILQNNKAQASEYLTKFSRLVRLILQNSQPALIPLENELEALQLYLELEAVRFDHHFEFKINVDKDLETDIIKVPPLIIQPYAENAIWHGLMHKEEKGQLDIEVSQENSYLFLKITDNGIGRQRAAALNSKSATKHNSMGLRITADRIALMQRSSTLQSSVTINDLVDPDGIAAGTEVIIKIPLIYD